ncbi:helix-turn-helix transcriptional regulator [Microbacterium sp. NPDC089320]|uniref:helix-turn-helix domain-containing protein n=1 Tax=Microbacterium sp. NPDC089320 TaxID=3155182 RepID=UPI00143ADC77
MSEKLAVASPVEAVSFWLYAARSSRGMSQEAIALRAGLAVPTYGRLERSGLRGQISQAKLETFVRLLVALDPDASELGRLIALLKLYGG